MGDCVMSATCGRISKRAPGGVEVALISDAVEFGH
jgi:hypothetical protein